MATLVGLSCAGSNAVGICTLPPPGGPPRRPCRSSPVRCIRHALYHALHHMHALHLAHCIMHASHRAHPTVHPTESWSEVSARAITTPQTCDKAVAALEAYIYVSIFPALPPSFLKLATQASCIPGAIRKRKRLGSLYSMHSRTPDGPSTSSDPSPASSEDPSSDSPPSESAPRAAPARTPRPRRSA